MLRNFFKLFFVFFFTFPLNHPRCPSDPADKDFQGFKELIRRYRRYVYEAGALDRPDKMQARVIDEKVVAKERTKEFEISRASRLRYRNRYLTDSGIIGSKESVSKDYQRFKHLFHSKHEKKLKHVKGLDGMYSLKRLTESNRYSILF
jgi:hypothetical protein